ncbi:hypothetical protein ACFLV3_00800 [Chloroflexota bacterium]
MNPGLIKKIIRWLLLIVVLLYLITGLGITEFRTVEALTFGLLTKSLAFKLHDSLLISFVILLGLHIFFSPILKVFLKARNKTVL